MRPHQTPNERIRASFRSTLNEVDRVAEASVRLLAKRHGYRLVKSRQRNNVPNADNHGEFMVVSDRNTVVMGDRFDASLAEIAAFLEGGG